MNAHPPTPPPGSVAVFPAATFAASGGAASLSGLIVSPTGRITIAHRGAGLGVALDASSAAQLGTMLLVLAGELADAEDRAAASAAAELEAIVGGSGDA